jgi:hypothetical protein
MHHYHKTVHEEALPDDQKMHRSAKRMLLRVLLCDLPDKKADFGQLLNPEAPVATRVAGIRHRRYALSDSFSTRGRPCFFPPV